MRSVKHAFVAKRGKYALGAKRGKHAFVCQARKKCALGKARKICTPLQAREHKHGAFQAQKNVGWMRKPKRLWSCSKEQENMICRHAFTIGFKFVALVIGCKKKLVALFWPSRTGQSNENYKLKTGANTRLVRFFSSLILLPISLHCPRTPAVPSRLSHQDVNQSIIEWVLL